MKALGQRKGKIVLGRDFIDSLTVEDLSKLFTNFFPVSIQSEWYSLGDNLVYYGFSQFFDEIEEGTIIPEYLVEIEFGVPISWSITASDSDPRHNIKGLRFVRRDITEEPNEVKREHKLML